MARARNNSGFTLLEIVVSITILALIALMISRIFSTSTQAVERGKNQALLDETARMLLDVIEQDVSQALIRTNIAFRVHQVTGGDALYFVSTGVRRKTETLLRDTAPMRLKVQQKSSTDSGLVPALNRRVIAESALGTEDTIRQLIASSDYYLMNTTRTVDDFSPVHGGKEMGKGESEYTSPLETTSGTANHAMLTFVEFLINGDPASNLGSNTPPDKNDMPCFVDVALGLASAIDMQQAMHLYNAQDSSKADEYIENHERIYTRRIFMRNTSIDQLDL